MEEDEQNMTPFIIIYCIMWMLIIYGFITTL
jgi:Mg2+ and Co2+ transporter CorA